MLVVTDLNDLDAVWRGVSMQEVPFGDRDKAAPHLRGRPYIGAL